MQVIINGKTYEVVNGVYHLVATYDLARQIGGLNPGEHGNELIRKGFVSEAGCRIKSTTVIPDYYTDNTQCVLYEDLELDPDIILDGDETESNYDYALYTSSDGSIIQPNDNTWYTLNDGELECKHKTPPLEEYAVDIPNGTFSGITTLTSFKTAVGQSIGVSCFNNCANLEKAEIVGNANTSYDVIISNNAFMNCTKLKTVIFGSYWYNPMDDKVIIGQNAFYGDVNLKHLQGQDNIKTIGDYAFKNCSGLTVLTLLNCDSIGNQAFENCTNITKIIVKGSATFGSNIFSGCTNIEEIIFLGDCTSGLTNIMTQLDAVAKATLKVRVPNEHYSNYYNKLSGIDTSKEWKTQLSNNKYESYNDIVLCYYDTKGNDGVWDTAVAFGWLKYNIRHLTIYESEIITNFPQIANSSVVNNVFDKMSNYGDIGYRDNQGEHLLSFNQFKWFTGLTSVPYAAFSGCTNLSSVTIGNSVASIGAEAFYGCTGLTSMTIPDSVTSIGNGTFYDCRDLTSVTIGNSVASIGDEAFYDCYNLVSSLVVPNNVTSIGYDAFCGVANIVYNGSATWNENNTWWGAKCLNGYVVGSFVYENAEHTILAACFPNILSVAIPSTVETINSKAFENCTALTSVVIPDSVTSIGDEAFMNCRSLSSITIPDSVITIGGCVCSGCTRLSSATIGTGVTSVGYGAFSNCDSLNSITIPDSVTSIGNAAFCYCSKLTNITIPNNVATIGQSGFTGCNTLSSITIGSSVTSIGNYTFADCTSLNVINYNGSTTQWASISKGYGWNRYVPAKYVQCSDGLVYF